MITLVSPFNRENLHSGAIGRGVECKVHKKKYGRTLLQVLLHKIISFKKDRVVREIQHHRNEVDRCNALKKYVFSEAEKNCPCILMLDEAYSDTPNDRINLYLKFLERIKSEGFDIFVIVTGNLDYSFPRRWDFPKRWGMFFKPDERCDELVMFPDSYKHTQNAYILPTRERNKEEAS